MKDRVFVDTNVFVYAILEDTAHAAQREEAVRLIQDSAIEVVSSTQVINELYTALLKNGISDFNIQDKIGDIIEDTEIMVITVETIRSSWKIKETYKYSYWDSLIIASAIASHCKTLFTEDLQNNQLIENSLRIINPLQ